MRKLQAQPPASFGGRLLDWLRAFDEIVEMRPSDELDLRVAALELQVANLTRTGAGDARPRIAAEV